MPYVSDAQRRYFNVNRHKLEAEGVDVDEWNKSTKGKKLPKHVKEAANRGLDDLSTGVGPQLKLAGEQKSLFWWNPRPEAGDIGRPTTQHNSTFNFNVPRSRGPGVSQMRVPISSLTEGEPSVPGAATPPPSPTPPLGIHPDNFMGAGGAALAGMQPGGKIVPSTPVGGAMAGGAGAAAAGSPSRINPALLGALLGAGAGVVHGAVNPGKKRRLAALLQGAGLGAGIGGVGGLAYGGFGGMSAKAANDVDPDLPIKARNTQRYLRAGFGKVGLDMTPRISYTPGDRTDLPIPARGTSSMLPIGRTNAGNPAYRNMQPRRSLEETEVLGPPKIPFKQNISTVEGLFEGDEEGLATYRGQLRDAARKVLADAVTKARELAASPEAMLEAQFRRVQNAAQNIVIRSPRVAPFFSSATEQFDAALPSSLGLQHLWRSEDGKPYDAAAFQDPFKLPSYRDALPKAEASAAPAAAGSVPTGAGGQSPNATLLGALLGAGGGAVAGALRPGSRGRLQSALMGAGAGGLLGGGLGASYSQLKAAEEKVKKKKPETEAQDAGTTWRRVAGPATAGVLAGVMARPLFGLAGPVLQDLRRELLPGAEKSAYDAANTIHMQQFSPQMPKRELSPDEQSEVDAGKRRWLPKIFQSYATPVSQMMSSPGKGALMNGALGALSGAAIGGSYGYRHNGNPGTGAPDRPHNAMIGALLGAAAGGIPMAALSYFNRKANNEGLEELMRRLPAGATKRDLLADSVYQKDLDRQTQQQQNDMQRRMLLMAMSRRM